MDEEKHPMYEHFRRVWAIDNEIKGENKDVDKLARKTIQEMNKLNLDHAVDSENMPDFEKLAETLTKLNLIDDKGLPTIKFQELLILLLDGKKDYKIDKNAMTIDNVKEILNFLAEKD